MTGERVIIKQGWMYKRGEYIKTWRKRYYVLTDDGFLWGFKEDSENFNYDVYQNKFDIKNSQLLGQDLNKTNCFILRIIKKSKLIERLFRCTSQLDQSEWITEIKKIAANLRASISLSNKQIFEDTQKNINQYTFITELAKGANSKVMLIEAIKDSKRYATKVIKKEKIKSKNMFDNYIREFKLVETLKFDFIAEFYACNETREYFYIIMEYLPGGNLFSNLKVNKIFPSQNTRLYTAEITLALEYLHKRGIVHCDLKLENVMLNEEGHIKLVDFNLSKNVKEVTTDENAVIGTTEYIPPEIILGEMSAEFAHDWWALGILTFECLVGYPPFHNQNGNDIVNDICYKNLNFPLHLENDSIKFITALLEKDPKKRLGSKSNGAEEVKNHQYFSQYNWDHILNKRINPLKLNKRFSIDSQLEKD